VAYLIGSMQAYTVFCLVYFGIFLLLVYLISGNTFCLLLILSARQQCVYEGP